MRLTILILVAAGAVASVAAGAADAPTVLAKIAVAPAGSPCAAASAGGFVWVSEYSAPVLLKIDRATNKVVAKAKIGAGSCGLGVGAGSLWVEDTTSNTISRVSIKTAKRTAAIKVDATPYDSTFAFGADWFTSNGLGTVGRIDPRKNKVVHRLPLGSAVGAGVIRIDPATNKVIAKLAIASAGWTAASADAVWVTTRDTLVRIDPATNRVTARIKLASTTLGDPDVVAGQVWVPLVAENAIAVIDPATNAVVETVNVGQGPFVVTQVNREAWIPSWKGTDIWRLEP